MTKTLHCLNKSYSTTRFVTTQEPEIIDDPAFRVMWQLSPNVKRKGEGGLRTKGYFKRSIKYKPLISIITVVNNADKYIEETILSIIHQTYDNVEYIVIDGGSNDNTLKIIKKYQDAIDYWVSEPDEGIYDAMNKGIYLARGEWLNFINAGDKFVDESILYQIRNELKDNFCVYSFAFNEYFYSEKKKYIRYRHPKDILYDIPTCHNAMFFPNNKKITFDTNYRLSSDFNLFLEYIQSGYKHSKKNLPVIFYLRGGLSDKQILRMLTERILINIKHLKKSWLPFYIFYYFREFFAQMLKRVLPMTVLNKIRQIKNFEYTELNN